ncbi:MAG: hypothetical protein NVSMB31_01390 [Vulcanimicrobiaceae bacterium]
MIEKAVDTFRDGISQHTELLSRAVSAKEVKPIAAALALRESARLLSERAATYTLMRSEMVGSSISVGVMLSLIDSHVASTFGIPTDNLHIKRRDMRYIIPRHVAMYLARKLTKASSPVIAKHYGLKDHTTVIYAAARVSEKIRADFYDFDMAALEDEVAVSLGLKAA